MLFQTGDLGFVSPSNSQLYVCGRCDDTVKVNGVKCNLTAIDSFLTGVIDDVISNPKSQYRRFASLRATVTLLIESIQRKAQIVAVFPIKSISGKIDKVKLKVDYHSGVYDHTALAVTKQQHSFVRESALTDTIGRERARAVFAKFLGLEAVNKNAVRPMDDEDFSQLGGDSMTAMLIVSELRYRGIPGNIMHFAGSGRIGILLDQLVQPKEAGDICADLKTSGTFVFEWYPSGADSLSDDHVFNSECKEIVVQMLASSFHQLEPISRCLHFSEEALSLHVEAQLRPDCPNRAVVLLAGFLPSQPDAAGSLNPHSLLPHVRMSMLLLQPSHESPTEEAKRPTGMEEDEHLPPGLFEFFDDLSVQIHITIDRMLTINCHMLGLRTDEVLGTDAKIRLGTLLEKEAMKTAQRMGYKFIDTVNTNQLTQAICENLGYELMNQADFVAYAQDRGLICDPSVGEINCKYMVKRLSPAEDMNA
ncbi:unnamed protein product [Schistocephalus solidus]|uniref:Carrier domain-containing protein n=1 Tax=Schistocephalus solidus TaxID=70667 RepID=A0A183T1Z4_SCHSO|nr:unnamed protein product [Schistocephalus solidus]